MPIENPLPTPPDDDKPSIGAQVVQLIVVSLVLALIAYFVIQFILGFIWWIVSILGLAVLFINRGFVMRLVGIIKGMYAKSTPLGLAATVGAILVFTPFMGFLFLKTIWDFRKSDFLPFGKKSSSAPVPQDQQPRVEPVRPQNNAQDVDHLEV